LEEVVKKLQKLMLFGALAGAMALTGALVPSAATAQDAGGGAAGAGGGDATTYDFEDDLVSGDLVRPDGEMLSVRRRGRRSSLIRIREHFIPEMLKSVEDL
jgi:hypothetical protein